MRIDVFKCSNFMILFIKSEYSILRLLKIVRRMNSKYLFRLFGTIAFRGLCEFIFRFVCSLKFYIACIEGEKTENFSLLDTDFSG